MSTEKLYYADPYMRSFTARVTSCVRGGEGWLVVTDRSAFYPEGGGQPGDTGVLGGAEVKDTRDRGGDVVHVCASPLEVGSEVEGSIDWPRRFDLMQQHSGEHIVSGLIHRRFGYDNVGFHLGSDTVTIDFNGPISPEELSEIELAANEVVWEDRPFVISCPCPEELAALDYRSKKELSGQVRIVECPGADVCACCGTHVASAGELGLIKLLSVQHFRSGVRIEMLSGRRAYERQRAECAQNAIVSALLSAKPEQTGEAARRMSRELAAVKYRLVGLEMRAASARAEELRGRGDVLLFEDGLDGDALRRLAAAVTETCGGRCAVFTGSDDQGYRYAIGAEAGGLDALARSMNAALGGRGGGKPGFIQGSVTAKRAEIEGFFAAL